MASPNVFWDLQAFWGRSQILMSFFFACQFWISYSIEWVLFLGPPSHFWPRPPPWFPVSDPMIQIKIQLLESKSNINRFLYFQFIQMVKSYLLAENSCISSSGTIQCIECISVLSTIWVVYAHAYWFYGELHFRVSATFQNVSAFSCSVWSFVILWSITFNTSSKFEF